MRLIDADYLKEALGIFNDGDPHFLNGIETAREVIDNAPTIEAEPAWKPATIKPKTDGEYLVLWGLPGEHICGPYYKLLKYGTFEDDGDNNSVVKLGWYEWDNDFGAIDYTDSVRYWTELPDKLGVEE